MPSSGSTRPAAWWPAATPTSCGSAITTTNSTPARGIELAERLIKQDGVKFLLGPDAGYVLVAGKLAKAGEGKALLADPDMGRLFLGG